MENYPKGNSVAAIANQSATSLYAAALALAAPSDDAKAPVAVLLASSGFEIFLRIETVELLVGLSTPSIYRLMSVGDFPTPVKVTTAARRWRLSDVASWMRDRAAGAVSGDGAQP